RIVGDEICARDDSGTPVCVTGTQLRSLLSGAGSVLGTSTQQPAAGTSGSGETEAPSGPSIVNGEKNMDTASSTSPVETQQATSSPGLEPSPEPVSDQLDATGTE